jgi:uncharacterized membrane protein YjgN (DUF898 family)
LDQDRQAATGGIEPYPLEFDGTGGEYFRVWIVNVLLTIVTFGFYTPFARRRTAQYFWGHTVVAGSPLEFTAPQKKMVLGFLVLVGLYLAFQVAAETGQDTTVALFFLGGAALAPWFWGSAMRFRLAATRWRGVRLNFGASWGQVYRASWPVFAIALAWMAAFFVIGFFAGAADVEEGEKAMAAVPAAAWLLVPVALIATVLCVIRLEFNYKSLLVERSHIGTQYGRWKPVYGDFVRIWLATVGVFLACMVLVAVLAAAVAGGTVALFMSATTIGAKVLIGAVAFFAAIFVLMLASAPARAYREARLFQLVWNNVGVSRIARFKCRLKPWRFVRLRVLNLFLTLLTLGFYRPFALVSEYRLKTESVTLHVKGGLDQLAGQLVQQQGGIGDAMADAVGLDLVG